jgi:hypothetical protein
VRYLEDLLLFLVTLLGMIGEELAKLLRPPA